MKTTILLLAALVGGVSAQTTISNHKVGSSGEGRSTQEHWSEGFGRAPSYRAALAHALGDAVAKSKGVVVALGPFIRSRLTVIRESTGGEQAGFFDGKSGSEREWVQQQISGFVQKYKVTNKIQDAERDWEVTVRASVASLDKLESALVIELQGNDLSSWQLQRFEEDELGSAFDRRKGRFEGPKIGEYLRRSGAVKVVSQASGVRASEQSEPAQREKLGHELVASHRVVVNWESINVNSVVERPNRARPTSGPRPEYMQGGSVRVALRIENLIERTVLLEETFAVAGDNPASFPVDRQAAFITAVADKAKAEVAKKIFFMLRPPIVMRKWAGDGGKWFVEARISRRLAAGFKTFSIGNNGSLGNPDWQSLGSATLVGGSAVSCTFQINGVNDLAGIEPKVSEVRPIR